MYVTQCAHADCKRHFQVNEFSAHESPLRGMTNIVCPHCGNSYEGEDERVYLTHPLSREEENGLNQVAY